MRQLSTTFEQDLYKKYGHLETPPLKARILNKISKFYSKKTALLIIFFSVLFNSITIYDEISFFTSQYVKNNNTEETYQKTFSDFIKTFNSYSETDTNNLLARIQSDIRDFEKEREKKEILNRYIEKNNLRKETDQLSVQYAVNSGQIENLTRLYQFIKFANEYKKSNTLTENIIYFTPDTPSREYSFDTVFVRKLNILKKYYDMTLMKSFMKYHQNIENKSITDEQFNLLASSYMSDLTSFEKFYQTEIKKFNPSQDYMLELPK